MNFFKRLWSKKNDTTLTQDRMVIVITNTGTNENPSLKIDVSVPDDTTLPAANAGMVMLRLFQEFMSDMGIPQKEKYVED